MIRVSQVTQDPRVSEILTNQSQDELLFDHLPPANPTTERHYRSKPVRYDTFGNKIKRRRKAHHIAFKEQLAEVHIVENWKHLNSCFTLQERVCPC
jgi:hypothetical protein